MTSELLTRKRTGVASASGNAEPELGIEPTPIKQAVWILDLVSSEILWANNAAVQLWNCESLEELRRFDILAHMPNQDITRIRQLQDQFQYGQEQISEAWITHPANKTQRLHVAFSAHRMADGRMGMVCESLLNQRAGINELRSIDALRHTSVMITLYDHRGRFVYRNPAARASVCDERGSSRKQFVSAKVHHELLRQMLVHGKSRVTAQVRTNRGVRWHEIQATRNLNTSDGTWGFLLSEVDVSEVKHSQERNDYLAHHDPLTGLPNRAYVLTAFQKYLDEVLKRGEQAALINIDLDHFNHINNSLGHTAGDKLLVQLANRLKAVVREGDMFARMGGDEFLILTAANEIGAITQIVGQRFMDAVSQPIIVANTEVRITPSLGICLAPRDGMTVETLMRNVDLATIRAKEQGRNRMEHYTSDMSTMAQTRLVLENELRLALNAGQFEVFYQPRVNLENSRIIGAEALVRWRHPVRGIIPPAEFIPLCEDCGLIGQLGTVVLEQAAHQQARWRRCGLNLHVSVNLSPRQLSDPYLIEIVKDIVRRTKCDPDCMELEITESVLVGHDHRSIALLHSLRDIGFHISIDDFGTGYSNLAYLQRYPISCLKIDRSFVSTLEQESPITMLIITMCRSLGLKMVAEGVETELQREWLRAQGCHEYQGFLCSPGVPHEAFDQLLAEQGDIAQSCLGQLCSSDQVICQ